MVQSSGNLSEEGAYTFLFFPFSLYYGHTTIHSRTAGVASGEIPIPGGPPGGLGTPSSVAGGPAGSPHPCYSPSCHYSHRATAMTVSAATPLDHQVLTYHCLLIEYIGKVLGSRK